MQGWQFARITTVPLKFLYNQVLTKLIIIHLLKTPNNYNIIHIIDQIDKCHIYMDGHLRVRFQSLP